MSKTYESIIRDRQQMNGGMLVGKHKAANANFCDRMIKEIKAAGLDEAADWAVWMVWWRLSDNLFKDAGFCVWTYDANGFKHDTGCEEGFLFDGSVEESGLKFCPFCGKQIKTPNQTIEKGELEL